MKKMKQFKLFTALAGLMLCVFALAPHAAVAQTAAELKAELQGYGFQNSEEVLDWLLNSDHEGPFHMVNLLKFHGEANYPEDYQGERGTGLDAQRRYTETIVNLVMQLGIRPVVRNQVVGAVGWLGENQDWDMITVNYYPDRDSFFKLVRSETYQSAGVHKHAALERTMTIVTLPGGPIVDPAKATDK
jgi:uncharacterized protein (DUF1330 family)